MLVDADDGNFDKGGGASAETDQSYRNPVRRSPSASPLSRYTLPQLASPFRMMTHQLTTSREEPPECTTVHVASAGISLGDLPVR